MDDLAIRGGHVIDGTGAPGHDGDLSIHAGRIVAVETRSTRPARRVLTVISSGTLLARALASLPPIGPCPAGP